MRRAVLLAAALALPLTGVTSVALAGQAGAATTIVCTSFSGNVTSTSTIGGCTGGATGGGSQPLNSSALAVGGTITWLSNNTTTLGAPALAATSAKKCPGYKKGATSNPAADKISGAVTADVGDGIKIPGKFSGAVCISPTGAISALKPLKIT